MDGAQKMVAIVVVAFCALIAVISLSSEARGDGHCRADPTDLIASLTGEYGENLIATGDSSDGPYTFYGEPFDPAAGGITSPESRTGSILMQVTGEDTQCIQTMGVNLRILPTPRQVYPNGFESTITMLRDEMTAFVVMVHPTTREWHIVTVMFIGTPLQNLVIVTTGTNFTLLSELDPHPEKAPTPWN